MIHVNAIGEACPLPLIKAKKAIEELNEPSVVEVLVDNEIAVQNLKKLADQMGYEVDAEVKEENVYSVKFDVREIKTEENQQCYLFESESAHHEYVVAIGSNLMGEGDEALGKILVKGFIFALTQMEQLPETILFYNSGAFLSCEGSESLEDLKKLEAEGVQIKTCGTCLNHYELSEKLAVGEVTNMYVIVDTMAKAGKVIKP